MIQPFYFDTSKTQSFILTQSFVVTLQFVILMIVTLIFHVNIMINIKIEPRTVTVFLYFISIWTIFFITLLDLFADDHTDVRSSLSLVFNFFSNLQILLFARISRIVLWRDSVAPVSGCFSINHSVHLWYTSFCNKWKLRRSGSLTWIYVAELTNVRNPIGTKHRKPKS